MKSETQDILLKQSGCLIRSAEIRKCTRFHKFCLCMPNLFKGICLFVCLFVCFLTISLFHKALTYYKNSWFVILCSLKVAYQEALNILNSWIKSGLWVGNQCRTDFFGGKGSQKEPPWHTLTKPYSVSHPLAPRVVLPAAALSKLTREHNLSGHLCMQACTGTSIYNCKIALTLTSLPT